MPRPKHKYKSTRHYIPNDLWPEVAKMIEEYKQEQKSKVKP